MTTTPDLTLDADEVEELRPCERWDRDRIEEAVAVLVERGLVGDDGRFRLSDALASPLLLGDSDAVWLACRVAEERDPVLGAALALHAGRAAARLLPREPAAAVAAGLLAARLRALRAGSLREHTRGERRECARNLRHLFGQLMSASAATAPAALALACAVEDDHALAVAHLARDAAELRRWRRHAARLALWRERVVRAEVSR